MVFPLVYEVDDCRDLRSGQVQPPAMVVWMDGMGEYLAFGFRWVITCSVIIDERTESRSAMRYPGVPERRRASTRRRRSVTSKERRVKFQFI